MSVPPPDDRGPYGRRRDEPDPEVVRRQSIVTLGLLAFVVVLVVSFVATRSARDGVSTSLGLGLATNDTGSSHAAGASGESTATTTPATTTTVMAPIEVQSVLGAAIIAGHISCKGEGGLSDNAVATVQAAVAEDNNTPSEPGATPKPYANDEAAQNEIVRASVQKLHDEQQFYADCAPVPGSGSTAAGSSSANGATLPPSR